MRSNKLTKKVRKQSETDGWERRGREKLPKAKKITVLKKKMDWRDLLMEEEENFLNDR